ncbi:MAG: hypothetical protein ACI825_001712 [Planctomycetota bacterium]|jgi:hypothetical protein|uniref:hypothetical protein n=1 Tax=Patiriisocius sp. Uisw_047 TaxID=3230969 RepID=UPI0039EB4A65
MRHLLIFLLLFSTSALYSQIERPNRVIKIEADPDVPKPDPKASKTGFELPKINLPTLSKEKDPKFDMKNLGNLDPKPLDITKGDGLLDYKTDKAPKYFTAEKQVSDKYARDQDLGEVSVSRSLVNVVYRDHEAVDGDRIMVLVNEDIVRANVSLYGSFQGFDLPLQKGPNKIEFIALNQGESGPNTAELHIYDDTGKLISAKEWNLLTGYRATFIIVKD